MLILVVSLKLKSILSVVLAIRGVVDDEDEEVVVGIAVVVVVDDSSSVRLMASIRADFKLSRLLLVCSCLR